MIVEHWIGQCPLHFYHHHPNHHDHHRHRHHQLYNNESMNSKKYEKNSSFYSISFFFQIRVLHCIIGNLIFFCFVSKKRDMMMINKNVHNTTTPFNPNVNGKILNFRKLNEWMNDDHRKWEKKIFHFSHNEKLLIDWYNLCEYFLKIYYDNNKLAAFIEGYWQCIVCACFVFVFLFLYVRWANISYLKLIILYIFNHEYTHD